MQGGQSGRSLYGCVYLGAGALAESGYFSRLLVPGHMYEPRSQDVRGPVPCPVSRPPSKRCEQP